jgi:hypothetical protein
MEMRISLSPRTLEIQISKTFALKVLLFTAMILRELGSYRSSLLIIVAHIAVL